MSPRATPEPFRVKTAKVLRVLNSPGRQGVVDALMEGGPSSAAEVATEVECGVSAAHYHLKRLTEIGLVREAGARDTGARPERLFELMARDIVLDPDSMTPAFRREMSRGARIFLRHAERDLNAAIEEDCAGHRAAKRLRITRDVARLSKADLAELSKKLADIDAFLHARDDRSKEYRVGLTMILAPMAK